MNLLKFIPCIPLLSPTATVWVFNFYCYAYYYTHPIQWREHYSYLTAFIFFHSLEHVSLVSNICKTALLRKYDVCNNNEYRIQYNVLKVKNAIYWSNYHRTCINHILYSSRSCAFCMRFTKRIFFFYKTFFHFLGFIIANLLFYVYSTVQKLCIMTRVRRER